jgi:hypothetical protein
MTPGEATRLEPLKLFFTFFSWTCIDLTVEVVNPSYTNHHRDSRQPLPRRMKLGARMGVALHGPERDGRDRRDGDGVSRGVPEPLADLIVAMERTLVALAGEGGGRNELHALRNYLSDLCVLTQETPTIRRAVDRLVFAGDRLGEAVIAPRGYERRWRSPRLNKARQALTSLERTLAGARPSRIAVRLDRDW